MSRENSLVRIPNPMAGLRQFLIQGLRPSSDWLSPAIDERRIFYGGIPQKYIDGHQKSAYNCICINPTGFPMDGSEAARSTIRVDMFSYGGTFEEAGDIDLAAYSLLKPLRGAVVEYRDRNGFDQSIYIYTAIPGGPIYSRDPHLDWACVTRPYVVRFGERNVQME